jgi:hypothetical protein
MAWRSGWIAVGLSVTVACLIAVAGCVATPQPKSASAPRAGSTSFVETFDNNRGLERFRTGVFHRDVDVQGQGSAQGSWSADHNIHLADCGDPQTNSHTITKANRAAAQYVCRGHWMTSMGHVDSYSIVWASPKQTFTNARTVSWDVSATWLLSRLWWEVALVPANAPDVSCIDWLPCDVPAYPPGAVVVSTRDSGVRVWANNREVDATWRSLCHPDRDPMDPEGCSSKSIRRPWSLTDNRNGTLTVRFMNNQWTVDGAFPSTAWKVVFKHHAYTPDKDGKPVGYTWHWDNIVIK